MYLFWRLSYYLKQPSRYDQILTGALPYRGSNVEEMVTDICTGKRPSRPIHPSGNRWLPDPVWDTITISWHDQPNRRRELSVTYQTLALSSQQGVQHVKPGHLNTQSDGNLTIAGTPQKPKRRLGKMRPRISLPLQSLQNWESEIQRQVNEMNEVGSSTPPPPPQG